MPRKPIRGRYSITVPWPDGGSVTFDTVPTKYLTPAEIVAALRKHADEIETWMCRAAGNVVVPAQEE